MGLMLEPASSALERASRVAVSAVNPSPTARARAASQYMYTQVAAMPMMPQMIPRVAPAVTVVPR